MTSLKMYHDTDLNMEYPFALNKIVEPIKKGYLTKEEILQNTSLKEGSLSAYLSQFADFLTGRGYILPDNRRNILKVSSFIQSRLIDNEYSQSTPDKLESALKTVQTAEGKPQQRNRLTDLTEQETVVLNLLLEGYTPQNIADKLVLSLTTAKTHINNIYSKKGYHSLQELLVKEYKQKIKELEKNNSKTVSIDLEGMEEKLRNELAKIQKKLDAITALKEIINP